MYRNMSPSHMLPCRISREHLEGWPLERTRYFLEHLRARHAEVKAELDKKLGQIHEFFKFKNSDGWRTILERVAEWRNWWEKLRSEWISGQWNVTKPLFHPS